MLTPPYGITAALGYGEPPSEKHKKDEIQNLQVSRTVHTSYSCLLLLQPVCISEDPQVTHSLDSLILSLLSKYFNQVFYDKNTVMAFEQADFRSNSLAFPN